MANEDFGKFFGQFRKSLEESFYVCLRLGKLVLESWIPISLTLSWLSTKIQVKVLIVSAYNPTTGIPNCDLNNESSML